MKPTYAVLKQHHYSSNVRHPSFVDAPELYEEIGHDLDKLVEQNQGYRNTCAVRLSLALIKAGVPFSGRLRIKSGPYKDKMIEPGAKLLADQLASRAILGRPQVFKPTEAHKVIKNQRGVVLFWKIDGYGGGHIDLIETADAALVCNSACYFESREIWFWPLR